ncbi:MAG TPA: S8 family serine peptidase [Verrucomicrobiae bacterium]|nr:S8 family serine peptidase [Verrucomicrobiae bacterium]
MSDWPTLDEARSFLREGTGRGVKIAILDSGVETAHPELGGLGLADDVAIVEDGLGFRAVPGNGHDLFGHGTAIAGILRQLAPGAQLGSFRLLGERLHSRSRIIAAGVKEALVRGYDILNCSFGCAREDQVLLYKDWVDEAYIRGRHIVASCNNDDYAKREWPGHFPTVITVYFARCAEPTRFFWRRGQLVEFAARGQDVEVAWVGGGRKQVTGSSFAAPHLAGLLARLLSCSPRLTPLHAKALLQGLASPWPEGNADGAKH